MAGNDNNLLYRMINAIPQKHKRILPPLTVRLFVFLKIINQKPTGIALPNLTSGPMKGPTKIGNENHPICFLHVDLWSQSISKTPNHNGGKEGRHGVNFCLIYRRKPEHYR